MGVSAGQAGRVDDMVVGEKVEDKDEKGETAEEEKEEENVKEDQAKETEEEDKDDKENEGTEDTAGEAELELSRLKELVPSVCIKDNVSQLDVILEAIRYISSLQVFVFQSMLLGSPNVFHPPKPLSGQPFKLHFAVFNTILFQGKLADRIEAGDVVPVLVNN